MKKSILFFLLFLLLKSCQSSQKKDNVRQISYSCSCSTQEAKQIGMIRLLDDELEIYKDKKKIIFSPEIEEDIFQTPVTYLENFYFKEEPIHSSNKESEKYFIVKGNLNEKQLEAYLNSQNVTVVNNQKVYSRKGTGQKGLELILNYSREKQKQRDLDKDKYYRDRVDMLKRIKH